MKIKPKIFHLETSRITREIFKHYLLKLDVGDYQGADPLEINFIDEVQRHPIDILIIGINNESDCKVSDMMHICRHMQENYPGIRVIAHSVYSNATHIAELIRAGVAGIVDNSMGFQEFRISISEIANGRRYLPSKLHMLIANVRHYLAGAMPKLKNKSILFSKRELEVLALLAKGCSTNDIASQLYISQKTVETHRKNLVVKSATKNTPSMIAFSYNMGLI